MTGRTAPSNTPTAPAPKPAPPKTAGTAPTPAPTPKPVPEVLAGVTVPADEIKDLKARLAAANAQLKADRAKARELKAAQAKAPTARDYVRKIDLLILGKVGDLVMEAEVPGDMLKEVEQLLANQLHHLSSPERGWHGDLPKPDRSEWR